MKTTISNMTKEISDLKNSLDFMKGTAERHRSKNRQGSL